MPVLSEISMIFCLDQSKLLPRSSFWRQASCFSVFRLRLWPPRCLFDPITESSASYETSVTLISFFRSEESVFARELTVEVSPASSTVLFSGELLEMHSDY